MEQLDNINWQQLINNEQNLRKRTLHKAKQLLNKTTGYAKYLEQQNFTLENQLTARNKKLRKAADLIIALQKLATKQKNELIRLQENNAHLSMQLASQTELLRAEITLHAQTKNELEALQDAQHTSLATTTNLVTENNWQEFFVYKPLDAVI